MENSILNRKMFFALLTLFVFVFAINSVDTAAAAKTKLVEKGTLPLESASGYTYQFSYKIYKQGTSKSVLKVSVKLSGGSRTGYITDYFTKVSKNKIKDKYYFNGKYKKTNYFKTKLSSVNFARNYCKLLAISLINS